MSESAKKPGQAPESYQPKAKPEIVSMAEQAQAGALDDTKKKPSFQVDIFHIDRPLYAVGRAVRVTHGTPECFPAIDALIQGFDADDVTSVIPNKASPIIPFGVGLDHIAHGGDLIEFTYMRGVLVRERPAEDQLPEGMICHTIPAGYYARNHVRAKNIGEALGIAYIELDRWVESSEEWEGCGNSEYEVYTSSVYIPEKKCFRRPKWPQWFEMEKWCQVRRREEV